MMSLARFAAARIAAVCLVAPGLALAACGDGDPSSASASATPAVRIDTIGDTITVHTAAAGAWEGVATLEPRVSIGTLDGPAETVFGRVASIAVGPAGDVHVLDGQAAEIRVFDPSGAYLRTVGRRGEGPGELMQPSAIAVAPDGRIAARDPRNARLQVWSADGSETDDWPVVSPRLYTGTPLWIDRAGTSWVHTSGVSDDPTRPAPHVVVRVDPTGQVIDTLADPSGYVPSNEVSASNPESGTLSSSMGIPYVPRGAWSVHPDGSLLRTTVDGGGVEVVRPDGTILRITRDVERVPVPDAERAMLRERILESMRNVDSNWNWNGPPIPDTKPHVIGVHGASDGRIWALVSQPSREAPYPFHDPEEPDSPETWWTAPLAYEVYERDGRYVGMVRPDSSMVRAPQPVFMEDGAWGVTRDDLGVQRVVRYELIRTEAR